MPFPERLAIASKNPHKLRELGRICGDWPVEWSLNYCPTRSPQLNLTPVSTRERAFNVNEERYVLQYVHAYAAGDAQRQLGPGSHGA